jgi:hypothetical protein
MPVCDSWGGSPVLINDYKDLEEIQDLVSFRRMVAFELRHVSQEVDALKAGNGKKTPPWWTTLVFGALIALIAGWIGMVHQGMNNNTIELARIGAKQWEQQYLVGEVTDIKRRVSKNEEFVVEIPYIAKQVTKISEQLDRLSQRRNPSQGREE